MLFNPEWKPAEAPTLEPWQEILLAAAAVIERRGWTRKTYVDYGNRVCALGGLQSVQFGHPGRLGNSNAYPMRHYQKALARFQAHLRRTYPYPQPTDIVDWNDYRCKSKREAVNALREAAHEKMEKRNAV